MSEFSRADVCAVAVAETFRGDGEILVSPIGLLPQVGAKLAKLSFEPEILLTDGVASLLANVEPVGAPLANPVYEGWMPYRLVFDTLWSGSRHVMMGATQVDRYGNQNIAAIGDFAKPKAQLLGMRGAPGNTLNHPTSYWVPNHSPKVFVEKVDVVSGVGYDRAAQLSAASRRFHEIRRVVSNLGVFDFETPDHQMRLVSVHPGVSVADVQENTGFELVVEGDVPESRTPSDEELSLLRERIDPQGLREKEIRG
ncbi:MAG: CoA-transferase [Myxococcales bacterium]|nr:CoA-transferase [Myxococcales bacterium]